MTGGAASLEREKGAGPTCQLDRVEEGRPGERGREGRRHVWAACARPSWAEQGKESGELAHVTI
jgi:hypothetical protein